jgi:sulfur carrier protein ThiS
MTGPRATASIHVRLALFADLKRFLPRGHDGPLEFDLHPGATVEDLLAAAGIPATEEITIGLNGDQGQRTSVLQSGDEVVLFSPMEGG